MTTDTRSASDEYVLAGQRAGRSGLSFTALWQGRTKYLAGAVCVALSAIMLAPLVVSISASLKTTEEAAAIPPTYLTHQLSLDAYHRLWVYQEGLPTYLLNSGGVAGLTILFCLALTIPAGYALARYPIPGKELFFVFLLLALIVPYQALLTPLFFMFASGIDLGFGPIKLTNSLVGLAIAHTAIQLPFSVYIMRNSFEAVPRELEEAAAIDGAGSRQMLFRILMPAIRPASASGMPDSVSRRRRSATILRSRGGNSSNSEAARARMLGVNLAISMPS